ncbi:MULTISPECIES: hypothetical protein [unclassified Streptomyces]|uniref:hypothetical protein n=1 Tax=unclassified Streptomyces TaxID=2593676 RepID=UPI000367247E|nr:MULTISPECIES: hypothetical protein [unclassified Streptomyces]MYY06084.1 hypothetical protein [Streptomyces sp. SID4913]
MSHDPGDNGGISSRSYGRDSTVIGRADTLFQVFIQRASFVTGWLFLVLAVVLTGYAVWNWPGGSRKQYVVFFVFLVLAFLAAVAHIGVRRPERGRAGGVGRGAGSARPRLPDLLLIASLVFSLISWWSFQNVVRNGEVATVIQVTGKQPLTGASGSVLTLTMPQPERADRRDRLRLTLEVGEDDPSAPACSHKTRVQLTAVTQGVSPRRSDLPARSTTDFALGDLAARSGTSFELRVRTVEGCTLRLLDWQAVLHNT